MAIPSSGMRITEPAASPIPTQLVSGCAPPASVRTDSNATYGARMKNWIATSRCARVSAACEKVRAPVKRQTITRLATPSTTESRPKPISAIEDATIPETIATPPSTLIHASDSHDSCRTRRASSR